MRVLNAEVVANKKVLVRLDLDVPMENGTVVDSTRLQAVVPTLHLLMEHATQIILCGHRGRPGGKPDEKLSVKLLAEILSSLISAPVTFHQSLTDLPYDKVTLLENLRFFPGEEANDPVFAKELAGLADVFVFEAFGVAHRESASTVGVTKLLPSCAGFHVAQEVSELSAVLHQPISPTVVVLGGAKIETKLPVIYNLEDLAEVILVGGLLAKEAADQSLNLPENVVVAKLRDDGLDINAESIDRFATVISKAQTIIWNGPVGKFEQADAAEGTKVIAQAIVDSGAYTIVGGGDTLAALHELGLLDQIDFVSVGGGAMLEYLAGKPLPALVALE